MYERTYNKTVLTREGPPERKSFPWKKFIVVTSIFVVLIGFVFIIRASGLQVREVVVLDTHVADPAEVSQFVLDERTGYYLWILPKSSIVLVSPESIENRIKEHFPRFKEVTVERTSVHSLTVRIQEYEGVYLWCDEECSFMDEKGIVFADAPYFSGSAYLKIYSGMREPFPFEGLSGESLALVTKVDEKLRAIGIEPVAFRFVNTHQVSVDFYHDTHEANILFDPMNDVDATLETLYSGLRTDPLSRLYHDKSQVLEYLDVRFGGKLVYKFAQ